MTTVLASESRPRLPEWANETLTLTAAMGLVAKVAGVMLLPGVVGIASQNTVERVDMLSSTIAYMFVALLVAVVCGGSFELSRRQRISTAARAVLVAVSGLVIALISPSVVTRLHPVAALTLAFVTGVACVIAGGLVARQTDLRALGALLVLLGASGLFRAASWEFSSGGGFGAARALAVAGVAAHTFACLVAAGWVGSTSKVGRFLANGAVIGALALTYASTSRGYTSALAVFLHRAFVGSASAALPPAVTPMAHFLLPASILVAATMLLIRGRPLVAASAMLILLSGGSFDVPLQGLAAIASAQWALISMVESRNRSLANSRAASVASAPSAPNARAAPV